MEAAARLTIKHNSLDPGQLRTLLEQSHQFDSTTEAVKAAKLPAGVKGTEFYGSRLNDRAVIYFRQAPTQLQVLVFHLGGEPYHVAQSTFDSVVSALKGYEPKLSSASLEDKYGRNYATGGLGLANAISKEPARLIPLGAAVAAGVVVWLGGSTAAVQVPVWLTAFLYACLILKDALPKKVIWRTPKA